MTSRRGAIAAAILTVLAAVAPASASQAAARSGVSRGDLGAIEVRAPLSQRRPAAEVPPPRAWRGEIEGSVIRAVERDNKAKNEEDRVVIHSLSTYRARLEFTFQITPSGSVHGTGAGEYLEATWQLSGTNGDKGDFSCAPEVKADPFAVEVLGHAKGRALFIELRLKNAFETNKEEDCGADFTAFASDTHYVIDSLNAVGARELSFNQASPSLPTFTKHEEEALSDGTRTIDHAWKVTVTHDCTKSDYSDPARTDYINQFDVGDALDLPVSNGQKGGNACGPSSFTMAVNGFKRAGGSSEFPDLSDIYDDTITGGLRGRAWLGAWATPAPRWASAPTSSTAGSTRACPCSRAPPSAPARGVTPEAATSSSSPAGRPTATTS